MARQIIRQVVRSAAQVLLMEPIRRAPSLWCRGLGKTIKRGELAVEFGERSLEHLAALGVGRVFDLIDQTFAGEEKRFAATVHLLFGR